MPDFLKPFVAPATWITTIAAFIGVTGLAFNTFLSLFVGVRVAGFSSVTEHFGAGAGLLAPGLVYALDALVGSIYLVIVLFVLALVGIFFVRMLVDLFHEIVVSLARSKDRKRKSGQVPGKRRFAVTEETAEAIRNRFPFIGRRFLGMGDTTRAGLGWLASWRTVILTVSFAVFATLVLALWIPYTEAQRYRSELTKLASQSLSKPLTPDEASDATKQDEKAAESIWPCKAGPDSGLAVITREGRQLHFPILERFEELPARWLGASAALGYWFGATATGLKCFFAIPAGWVPIADLLTQPKLVAANLGPDKGVLRPMLSIADLGDSIVLYDFIFDRPLSDNYIHPVRTIKKSEIQSIIAIDPRAGLTTPPAANGLRPSDALSDLPVFSLLSAACGRELAEDMNEMGQEDPLKEVKQDIIKKCNSSTESERQDCIKQQFVNADLLLCQARELAEPKAGPKDKSPTGPSVIINVTSSADRPPEKEPPPDSKLAGIVDQLVGRVDEVDSRITQLLDSGIKVTLSNPQEPTVAAVPFSLTIYTTVTAAGGNKWAACAPFLTAWNQPPRNVEFAKGQFRLDGPGRHALVEKGGQDAWESLRGVFSDWTEQIIDMRRDGTAQNGRMVLYLVGRASQDGNIDVNLRLSEDRANAVKKAILANRPERWPETGLDEDEIIPVGEGETELSPSELTTSEATRRVDARVCFVGPEADFAQPGR